MTDTATAARPLRVFLLGATGTAGRATAAALAEAGHQVVALVRPGSGVWLPGVETREGDVTDPASLARDGVRGEGFDALVSCLASRTGAPRDAWAIDHLAHSTALGTLRESGVRQAVLLSAICVQKPRLAFQHAKLAFEAELMTSGLDWSIVRPTALFKSLSGQVARVAAGKPYLMFGDGRLTATKPISDRDLGRYMARCLEEPGLRNRVLPIGGPGPAITPREQGEALFRLSGRPPRYRSVPPVMLSAIAGGLALAGRISPHAADRAEFARTGHYYATESMLVWDEGRGAYDADATPEFGEDRLFDHYAEVLAGRAQVDLGAHGVFRAPKS